MGSGYTIGVKEEDLGIIPRVIRMIFDEKEARKDKAEIIIKCSFLEIYNEELHDLLEEEKGTALEATTNLLKHPNKRRRHGG